MIRVGIIGAGHWGEKHADAIGSLSNVRLVASSRTNPEALEAFVNKYGGKAYTRYQDLIGDPDVDAVAIATPHHLHTDIVIEAAKWGKHILLEKPIAPTLEECDQILQVVDENQVTFMAGHTNHFVPVYQKIKEILQGGELGRPLLITDRTLKRWWAPNRREWHLDRRTGGGMWMTIGVHNIDRMVWLMESRVKSICAHLATGFHDQNADDHGMALLRFENGSAGTAATVGYKTGAPSFGTEIVCSEGLMRIDKMTGISIAKDETWQHILCDTEINADNWMETAMVEEWRSFISAIETGDQPPITGEYARHIMAVIFAAEESAREKKEIRL